MPVRVLIFGSLAEATGTHRLEVDGVADLRALRTRLEERFPSLAGRPHRVALNQAFAHGDESVADGDEVALLPPFAGG